MSGEQTSFPKTFEEFAEQYKIVDTKQIYTNGTELIPIFRVKQWLEHLNETNTGDLNMNKDVDKIYDLFQDGKCKHWFRDNADMLYLATYLVENGIGIKEECLMGCPGTLSKYDFIQGVDEND